MSAALDSRATIRRMNELNHAMDAYLGDLARAGRTPDTQRSYRETLWHFADFLEREGVTECDRITPDLCRRFLNRYVGSSPSTQALRWTILNRFCAFLKAETVLPDNPMENIPRARRRRPEDLDVVSVTSAEVERLFAAAEGWQEILCLAVLSYMGPRRRAAARARRRDVSLTWEDGMWRGTIKFREKGGKPIVKPIPDELVALIRAADDQRVWASDDDYLIPNRRPHRNPERSPKVVYDTVVRIAARAGLRCHAHALRAAFAVKMDELHPGRLVAVKELLGHSRVETTMVYLRRQDKAREMELVRGLTWGSTVSSGKGAESRSDARTSALVGGGPDAGGAGGDGTYPGSGLSPNAGLPPAGFEPALPPSADEERDAAVAGDVSLPAVLLAKVEALRDRERV